ncbi:MAG: hypothetical protein ACFFCS_00925 [Candidatus Hodarchaeota archaeon]
MMIDKDDIFSLKSDLEWLDDIPNKIQSVFLDELYHHGVFNEVYNKYKRNWLGKKKRVSRKPVGVWGWNSWCGIHTFPLLTGPSIGKIYKKTVEVGLDNLEEGTGMLPHAVLHGGPDVNTMEDGFARNPTYRCYGGEHGEAYNLDNILCWAKMAMEYFLATNDKEWFTRDTFRKITTSIDYILNNLRDKYNPSLVYIGVEGDWTENNDWEGDSGNVNANMLRTLELAMHSQELLDYKGTELDYLELSNEIYDNFNKPVKEGGLWDEEHGYYICGNDGKGTMIHGDTFFESTVNYFSILWDIAPDDYQERIWDYVNNNRDNLELPYPVLTNHKPRTGARRKHYGKSVTNGDIWMVLGSHAAAARLQSGYIKEGTEMYKIIVDYDKTHDCLHNNLYQDGSANKSWDPEIGNNGAYFASLVLGVLGIKLQARGLEFNVTGLQGLNELTMNLFFNGKKLELHLAWNDGKMESIRIRRLDASGGMLDEVTSNKRSFVLGRDFPLRLLRVD